MKTCPNGHKYDEKQHAECPYCPKHFPSSPTAEQTAKAVRPEQSAFPDPSRTVVDNLADDFDIEAAPAPRTKSPDLGKTVILAPADSSSESAGMQDSRRLVGFLISFTWNRCGDYYVIREGKTRIGTDDLAEICIKDAMTSGIHAQLVFRNGVLRIKDSFSTNGTWVNEDDIGDNAVALKNRDTIRIGKTVFRLLLVEDPALP